MLTLSFQYTRSKQRMFMLHCNHHSFGCSW